jgi:hypothetical protein
VDAGVALVAVASGVLDLEAAEVAVEKLVHGGVGARVTALVHLGEQAGACLLGLCGGFGSGRYHLGEVVTFLGDRVYARVDPDAQRAAGQVSTSPRERWRALDGDGMEPR